MEGWWMCGVRCGVVMCNVARGLTGRRENINSQAVVAHQAKNAPGLCKPSAPTEPLQAQQFSGPLLAQSKTRRAFSSQARPPSLGWLAVLTALASREQKTHRAFASPVCPPSCDKAVLRAFASPERNAPGLFKPSTSPEPVWLAVLRAFASREHYAPGLCKPSAPTD